MKGVVKTAIPKVLKDAMTEFNETLAEQYLHLLSI